MTKGRATAVMKAPEQEKACVRPEEAANQSNYRTALHLSVRDSPRVSLQPVATIGHVAMQARRVMFTQFQPSPAVIRDGGRFPRGGKVLSLIHISEPTRRTPISYAVFCLKKKK